MRDWSLVAFTLLIQSAVGLMWVLLPTLCVDVPAGTDMVRWNCRLALALSLIGLTASLGHLGTQRNALHAIRNLSHSWLSREIAAVTLYTGSLVILLLVLQSQPDRWATVGVILCSIAGTIALYAMTCVYGLKTIPVWNNASTPLEIVGSALILGGVLGAAINNNIVAGTMLSWAIVGFVFSGIACKVLAGIISLRALRLAAHRSWYEPAPKTITESTATVLRILLLCCGAGAMAVRLSGVGGWHWIGLAVALCCAGEVWGRYNFYDRYVRIGL